MKREEVQQMVGDAVAKAMEPITKQLEAITKGEGGEGEGAPAEPESDVNADEVAKRWWERQFQSYGACYKGNRAALEEQSTSWQPQFCRWHC